MMTKRHPRRASHRRNPSASAAFTLIELLVVIAIIIVLAGMIFTVGPAVIDRGNRVQAASDTAQIVTAVKGYYTDYGTYPLNKNQTGGDGDTVFGDPGARYHNELLFNTLRGVTLTPANDDQVGNPRGIVYIEPREAKDEKDPKAGIARQSGTNSKGVAIEKGAWVDPWGTEYMVFIDANYDGYLDVGLIYSSVTPPNGPRQGAGAASLGKDAKLGKGGSTNFAGSDDLVSWQ